MMSIELLVVALLVTGCQNDGAQNSRSAASTAPPDTEKVEDAGVIKSSSDPETNLALASHLRFLQEEWSKVPNPVQATYRGAEFGDYFHLSFETSDGKWLDFGDGNNTLGDNEL